MGSLVLEIQRDAVEGRPVSELLRKALVISVKLKVSDTEWIERELNGYEGISYGSLPPYRTLKGIPKIFNPYHGWQPLYLPPNLKSVDTIPLIQGATQLEELAREGDGVIHFHFPPNIADWIRKHLDIPVEPYLITSKAAIRGSLDQVKNRVLQWSLQLEAAGVLGDNLAFSQVEVERAQSVTYNNTFTTIGQMHNSQLQQNSTGGQILQLSTALQNEVLPLLKEIINEARKTNGSAEDQIIADAETLIAQVKSPNPRSTIISESLASLRSIGEGAAGGALGNMLTSAISKILATLAVAGVT